MDHPDSVWYESVDIFSYCVWNSALSRESILHQHLQSFLCYPILTKKSPARRVVVLVALVLWLSSQTTFPHSSSVNPIQGGPFQAAYGCEAKRPPKSVALILQCYLLLKEDPKIYVNHVRHPLSSVDINIFFNRKSATFVISRKITF